MEGTIDHRERLGLAVVLAAAMTATLIVNPTASAAAEPESLASCDRQSVASTTAALASAPGQVAVPWRAILDADGAIKEHRVSLERRGITTVLRAGRRGFAVAPSPERLLIGERSAAGTTLTMVDVARGCRLWDRAMGHLVYDVALQPDHETVRLDALEPLTRYFEGTLLLDAESGLTEAMIDGECSTNCEPNDGEVPLAAYLPAGAARPVPSFSAGGWSADKKLPFRWRASDEPPKWARGPLKNAAADTLRSSGAQSPRFEYRSGVSNSVRYTPSFPSFCRTGIACASRSMPSWAVWIRPHGTDFSWGMLRWCQKKAAGGCFDLRRVMIHELGHITGLNHPSTAGFRLAPHETVMHAITPAKPAPSSTRHTFGRCDVATLQELYDVPGRKEQISTCNDVRTSLSLTADKTKVPGGGSVTFRAELRIADASAYGKLRRNALNGRSVKLKYRRAGSSDSWVSTWMKPLSAAGSYKASISPRATWEFIATFPAPANEGLRFSRSETLKVKVQS